MRSATALTPLAGSAPAFSATFDATGQSRLVVPGQTQRKHIWDLPATFHCSIVGTCLSNAEVRRILRKIGDPEAETASEHRLHGKAVTMAARQDIAGKLLNKALDQGHDRFIRRFAKARTEAALHEAWREASSEGDIAGGYWAAMTHPLSTRDFAATLFGEIHMLSHLVGRTNRADLKRLKELEALLTAQSDRIAELEARVKDLTEEKVDLAQSRDALRLEMRLTPLRSAAATAHPDDAALWRQRYETEAARAAHLSARLAEETAARSKAADKMRLAEDQQRTLFKTLALVEHEIASLVRPEPGPGNLDGRRLLYVGGRPNLMDTLRNLATRSGAVLLCHDGGIEDSLGLLPGLVTQCDTILFPVDCISHAAMLTLKRLSREAGKPFVPLRSASVSGFVALLSGLEAVRPSAC